MNRLAPVRLIDGTSALVVNHPNGRPTDADLRLALQLGVERVLVLPAATDYLARMTS